MPWGWTQPLKMSSRDFSWGKGGRCVRLTTYHHRSAEHQENPGLLPTRNPLGHLGLLWETFKFFLQIVGPATGHLDTGFSWFSCVYKRMLGWFPSFQAATTCLSCSPPDLNFLVTFFFLFPYLCTCNITTATG